MKKPAEGAVEGRKRDSEGPGQGEADSEPPALLGRNLFVLRHPAVSIVFSHNTMTLSGTLTIRVAPHKGTREPPDLCSSLRGAPACAPRVAVIPLPTLMFHSHLHNLSTDGPQAPNLCSSRGKSGWKMIPTHVLLPKHVPQTCFTT